MQNNIIGHNENIKYFFNMLKSRLVHHAIILDGVEGIGKRTFAFAISYFLLSHKITNFSLFKNEDFNLNNINTNIKNAIDKNLLDNFLYIIPDYDEKKMKYKDTITIDKIKQINNFLFTKQNEDEYRIIIIDSIDNLNISSCNALLKNLEEPNINTIFFIISHNYKNVINTIKSRCTKIKFNHLNNADLIDIANIRSITLDEKYKNTILKLTNGSVKNLLWYSNITNLNMYLSIKKYLSTGEFVLLDTGGEKFNYDNIITIVISILNSYIKLTNISAYQNLINEINYLSNMCNLINLDYNTVINNILYKSYKLINNT